MACEAFKNVSIRNSAGVSYPVDIFLLVDNFTPVIIGGSCDYIRSQEFHGGKEIESSTRKARGSFRRETNHDFGCMSS